MNSESLKNRILAATPLAGLIGETVKLTERGGLRVGCCPFHEENSPSFTVYPDHYFCYGCRENGDAITFTRKIKGIGFIDALKYLGEKAGIDTSELELQRQERSDRQDDAQLYKAMVIAKDIFKSNLLSPRGASARSYLEGRGFDAKAIEDFGFGLSLDEPRSLTDILVSRHRFHPRHVEACSLAAPSSKNGQLYDFFRNRITIPIYDAHSRLVAFGGRALDDYPPKYKNSRETRLFDKSSVLFGYHRAREFIRKGEPAIIVEGYMDVLQLWLQGFPGAVACMGTALKTQHLRLLSNVTNKVYLLFDGDQAGQKASLGSVSSALEVPRLEVRVATLPDDEDPDTFVQKNGQDALRALLGSSAALVDVALQQKLSSNTGVGLADVIQKDVMPWLAAIPDAFRRDVLMNKVSFHSGISKNIIETEVKRLLSQQQRQGAQSQEPMKRSSPRKPLSAIEFELLGHLYFAQPHEVDTAAIKAFCTDELELDEHWMDLVNDFLGALSDGKSPSEAERSNWLGAMDESALALLNRLEQKADAFISSERARAFKVLRTQYILKKRQLSIANLRQKLNQTHPTEAATILTAIMSINKEIASLENSLK